MFLILIFMLTCAAVLMMSSHPVTILCMIIIQTLTTCISIWIFSKSSWFSYILFLIFLGGLMVLFVYIVSLASNEKFEPSLNETSTLVTTLYVIIGTLILTTFFSKTLTTTDNFLYSMTMMIFSSTLSILIILIMTYLLFTLVVAVKISSKFEGPLRNFIK